MTWRALAACRGTENPRQFFDAPFTAALAICARCPVRPVCGDVGANEPYGVWGGTLPEERGFVNGTRDRRRAARRLAKAGAA